MEYFLVAEFAEAERDAQLAAMDVRFIPFLFPPEPNVT